MPPTPRWSTKDPRVCVVGNLNIDLLISGVPELPAWGQEVLGAHRVQFAAGQAGYLAQALAALGTATSVIGVVGDDAEGTFIIDTLTGSGVDTAGIRRIADEQTGLTIAVVRPDGERAFVSELGVSKYLTPRIATEALQRLGASSVVAVVGLFNTPGVTPDAAHDLLRAARARGSRTAFDPGWDPAGWSAKVRRAIMRVLTDVDLFLPNEDEALAITGLDSCEAALHKLAEACGGTVVVKRGEAGSIALTDDGRRISTPARTVAAANAVGAGDVFDAALVAELLRGEDYPEALSVGAAAAAHYVSRSRDRFPTREDLA